MPAHHASGLTKSDIVAALARLNELLGSRGVTGEICLFGGTVMVLVFNARISTRDVDAIFQPASLIRELAIAIAEERGLPGAWLNDGVKGFQSEAADTTTAGLPQFAHLRIFRPTAAYLLAMKCLAARSGEGTLDVDRQDIQTLVQHLELRTADEVLDVVEKFYPIERIPPKTQFMVHEVISALQKGG
jgi:hypothetical protein